MRRALKLVTGTVLTAALLAGGLAAPAAAAVKQHRVVITDIKMKVKDSETGQDENKTREHGDVTVVPSGKWDWDICAGGEARGELHLTLDKGDTAGHLGVGISVELYEGASCGNEDYANSAVTYLPMTPNTTSEQHYKVRSLETCGRPLNRYRCKDYVEVWFTIKNEYK